MSDENIAENSFAALINNSEELIKVESANNSVLYRNYLALLQVKDLILQKQTYDLQNSHKNPLNKFGKKCFSQTDEDGITLEIVRRLGIDNGVFAEFGVGNGLENNTLILASLGWRGFWVGGEELGFEYPSSRNFLYVKDWITLGNVSKHMAVGMQHIEAENADVISLDLDGNDIYFVRDLLQNGNLPKLFIVEYSAKFPPPVRFQIEYDPDHRWTGDDYFGASLCSFVDLFSEYGYELVCCNSHTGANAFFVKKEYMDSFGDVPKDINDIYVGPRYHLFSNYGHTPSAKVVETIFRKNAALPAV